MELLTPSLGPKLRLLCSFGGRIMPLPPANTLHYIGGETRLVLVPRGISFRGFFELISGKLLSGRSFSLKYRIPGGDLESLITISDNDDLQNMIEDYDPSRYWRIRLFLFPDEATRSSAYLLPPENTTACDAGGDSDKETEKVEIRPERFLSGQGIF